MLNFMFPSLPCPFFLVLLFLLLEISTLENPIWIFFRTDFKGSAFLIGISSDEQNIYVLGT